MYSREFLAKQLRHTTVLTNIVLFSTFLYIAFSLYNMTMNWHHASLLSSLSAESFQAFHKHPVFLDIRHEQNNLMNIRIILTIVCFLAFLCWKYKAYHNIIVFGVENRRFSPLATIGWYLVPLMNFYKPYLVMKEIDLGSDPDVQYDEGRWTYHWKNIRAGRYVIAWWASWWLTININYVLSIYYIHVGERIQPRFIAIPELQDFGIGFIPNIVAACASLYLVWKIFHRQRGCFYRRMKKDDDTSSATIIHPLY